MDPYFVLISEIMLQQTQVATVIPYFHRFTRRFQTIQDLAAADEQEVLRYWQGLGYYSRARNLHRCAKKVVADFDGKLPGSVEQLLELPGIGRYTAGALASIAFEIPAPILDGNVKRVICRLDQIEDDLADKKIQDQLWRRAAEILPKKKLGDFNSALMELGALICTPRAPGCDHCPVQNCCQARSAGVQLLIPASKKAAKTPAVFRTVLCIEDCGKYLIEQRPAKGRWAGMWQFVTLEMHSSKKLPETAIATRAQHQIGVKIKLLKPAGELRHALTHRRYTFYVYTCQRKTNPKKPSAADHLKWVTLAELDRYPLPRPHCRIGQLLGLKVAE